MRDWLRLVGQDVVRGIILTSSALGGFVLFAIGITAASYVSASSAGVPEAVFLSQLTLPGALLVAGLVARELHRRFPGQRRAALRGASDALGLKVVLDSGFYFVSAGEIEGRPVRLTSQWTWFGFHIIALVGARSGGHGYFGPARPLLQNMDETWLQSLRDDLDGGQVIRALLGPDQRGAISITPEQVFASGHAGWFHSPDVMREQVLAAVALGEVVERLPATRSEGTTLMQWLARANLALFPEDARSNPLATGTWWLLQLYLGLFWGTAALSLVVTVPAALLLPWAL